MDLMNMMGKMGEIKAQMEASKKKLDEIIVEDEFNGIKISLTASKKITNISVPQSLIEEGDKEQLEDLMMAALNRALEKANEKAESEAASVGENLFPGGLPGMF